MNRPDRDAQLAASLTAVEDRLSAACAAAGRSRADVTLVAVTKTWPASDAAALVRHGVSDLGEARDDEATRKAADVAALLDDAGPEMRGHGAVPRWAVPRWTVPRWTVPRWHMVGQVQSRKAASVARWASVVHSVDRERLARALGRAADDADHELEAFVQVDLDPARATGAGPAVGERGRRGGAAPQDLTRLCDVVARTAGLRLVGLMAVAPRGVEAAPAFERLRALSQELRASHPAATWLSAGMSGDVEEAVMAGATHVRVGSALLGGRPAPPG